MGYRIPSQRSDVGHKILAVVILNGYSISLRVVLTFISEVDIVYARKEKIIGNIQR